MRSNAPLSSSLGMVSDFSGATFDRAVSSRVWICPSESMLRRYTHAPYVLSLASQNPYNSMLIAAF